MGTEFCCRTFNQDEYYAMLGLLHGLGAAAAIERIHPAPVGAAPPAVPHWIVPQPPADVPWPHPRTGMPYKREALAGLRTLLQATFPLDAQFIEANFTTMFPDTEVTAHAMQPRNVKYDFIASRPQAAPAVGYDNFVVFVFGASTNAAVGGGHVWTWDFVIKKVPGAPAPLPADDLVDLFAALNIAI